MNRLKKTTRNKEQKINRIYFQRTLQNFDVIAPTIGIQIGLKCAADGICILLLLLLSLTYTLLCSTHSIDYYTHLQSKRIPLYE